MFRNCSFDLAALVWVPLLVAGSLPGAPWTEELAGEESANEPVFPLADHLANEARANTYTGSAQEDANLAVDDEGRVLVTWSSRRQELGTYGVFAQLFDSVGRPIGTEMHVNESLPGAQQDSYAAFGPDGAAWVAWSSIRPATEKHGIFVRRLEDGDDGFTPNGAEIRVGDSNFHAYRDPAIAVGEDGVLLAAWVKSYAGESVLELRRMSPDGEPIGAAVVADAPVFGEGEDARPGAVSAPDLAPLPGGGFFLVWARADESGRPLGIYGRSVEADGELGDVLHLSDRPEALHIEPSLDVDSDGRVTIAWMSCDEGGRSYRVLARHFELAAAATGASFEVDAGTQGHKSGATAIAGPDGRFAVAYTLHGGKVAVPGDKPLEQVEVRIGFFDARAEALAVHRLGGDEAAPRGLLFGCGGRRAEWTAQDQFAIAWTGSTPGDGSGVGVSLFTPSSLRGPAPEVVEPLAALSDLSAEDMRDEVIPILVPPHLRNQKRLQATYGQAAGTGWQGHDMTQFSPPDPTIGVGPDRVVTQVNGELAIFDHAGSELLRIGTNGVGGFWEGQGGGTFIVDPVNVFDRHSDRFFVLNTELATPWQFAFAVSTDSSPSGSGDWHKYRVAVSPTCGFADFPNIGYNDTAYFITTDCFSGGGNRAFIFDKSILNSGGAISSLPSVQMNGSLQSLGNTTKLDSGDTQYFVSAGFTGQSPNLRLQAITDPLGTPVVTNFTLNTGKTWGIPPDAPQMGSTQLLDTIDNRVKHGVVRGGKLYCAHNVGVGGITRVRWYAIDLNGWPAGGSPSVADTGDIDIGSDIYTWFPDVHPDGAGNLTILYCRSAANEFASIEYVTRLATDPPGTTSPPTSVQVGTAPELSGRYGDYGYVEEDPAEPGTFFGVQEYSEGPWATWVANWTLPGGGIASYCTAKSGLVCGTPAIGFSGAPEVGATSGFVVSTEPTRGNRAGLVLYSCTGRAAIPFQGGLLCVNPTPLRRTPPVDSGGTPGGCDGVLALDFNAFASGSAGGNPDPCLATLGQRVNAQWWGRDSVATGSLLSDGLEFYQAP